MTYSITRDFINKGKARSGQKINTVRFIVSHDIGNGGSTAYSNRNYFNNHQPSASAHTFIDDNYILEIVPLDEKAWHVQYNTKADNKMFGDDANDCAIGVELCHGGNINFKEAYDRYVWYHAYLCKKYALNPYKDIVGHYTLDPQRRSDPINAFKPNKITWDRFISDIVNQLNNGSKAIIVEAPKTVVKTEVVLNPTKVTKPNVIRKGDKGPEVKTVQNKLIAAGFTLPKYGADSDYGDETVAAVKAFQKAVGITVDGIVGSVTLSELNKYKKPTKSKSVVPYPGKLIKRGSRGDDVKRVQRAVGVKADGIFGPNTDAAVRAYQKRHGLKVDGLIGKNTWSVMF